MTLTFDGVNNVINIFYSSKGNNHTHTHTIKTCIRQPSHTILPDIKYKYEYEYLCEYQVQVSSRKECFKCQHNTHFIKTENKKRTDRD